MSKEFLKFCNEIYTISNKLNCLVGSHINININFDNKLKEISSLIADNKDEVNLKVLIQQLSELHSLLDTKLKHTEEVNLMCYKQSKYLSELNSDTLETTNISQNLSDTYSEIDNSNCDMSQSKVKSNDFVFGGPKMSMIMNRNDNFITPKKLPPVSRYLDDSVHNSPFKTECGSGPLLRKKLNFNIKPNKHKTKKFVPFKKQGIFKMKNEECANMSKRSSNMRLAASSDSKYSSYNKKRKRLSLSQNGLIYSKNTRNQLNKSWDHEDTRVYCICNKPSYGDMIACDSEKCKIEWFHYKCVDITTSPKGDWFCPMCKID